MSRYGQRTRLTGGSEANSVNKWYGGGFAAMNTSFESIATTTVGSGGSSTITFASIPQTYSHLQLRMLARGTTGTTILENNVRYNGVTSAYSRQLMYGDGASVTGDHRANGDSAFFMSWFAGGSAASNIFGVCLMDILDYTNTNKFTTTRVLTGVELNGSGYVGQVSSYFSSTSAISSIVITPLSGNYTEYSHFALYGIKAAA